MKNLLIIILLSFFIFSCESEFSKIDKEARIENEKIVAKIDSLAEKTNKIITSLEKETWFSKDSLKKDNVNKLIDEELAKDSTPPGIRYTNNKETPQKDTIKRKGKVVTAYIDTKPIIIEIPDTTEPVIDKTTEVIPQVKAEIHKTWDNLLRKHVSSSGKVNYDGFVSDKDVLNKYIKELKSFYKDLSSWSKNKRLAYWINVYNAVTIKLITDNYPTSSITKLKGGKPWNVNLIDLGGVSYTLDAIENKIIRPKFNEPRIHFAVNCAAKSCPKIMNKAWTEDNIQRYLTKQTKAFINNTQQNSITTNKIELSKIFEWYKVDFAKNDVELIEYINKYSDVKIDEKATITFKEYNWNLNN